MPTLNRIISRTISETVAIARIAAPPRRGLRVLMYHAVGSPADGDKLGIYTISAEALEKQISALASLFPGAVTDLASGIGTNGSFRIAVTFDDGYRDNLHCAAPLLQKFGIPFTVFVCSDFVRHGRAHCLSPAELRELAVLPGVSIGSHGATHSRLTELDDQKLSTELASSKAFLEDAIGRGVTAISYPHGAVDGRVRAAAAASGYKIGACSRFNINDAACDPLLLCRTDIHGIDSLRVFKQKLHGDWDWMQWK